MGGVISCGWVDNDRTVSARCVSRGNVLWGGLYIEW